MFGNSREDELLSKLKNCIGSLKNENSSFQESKVAKNAYSSVKENYQTSIMNPNKNINSGVTNKNSTGNPYQYGERQPLVTPNYAPVPSYYAPPPNNYQPQVVKTEVNSQFNRYQPEVKQSTLKGEDYRSYQITPKKFQYAFDASKLERQEKYAPIVPTGVDSSQKLARTKQQEVRGEISRRYSVMQNERIPNRYSELAENPARNPPLPTRNYQQQVEQRKQLLESALERRERTPVNLKKDYNPVIGSIRKQSSYTSRDPGKIIASQSIYSSRKVQKPLPIRQNLQRAYEEQKSPNTNECSALSKLRKISELNEKINDRIRNIINVFEEHKC